MTTAAKTGAGATLALSVTGAVGNIRRIGGAAMELGKLEASHLGTTGHKIFIPDDLIDPGNLEIEAEFDKAAGIPSQGVLETATVTFGGGGTLAGSGFIGRVQAPECALSTIQVLNIRFEFNGLTPPTFSAA
jgi:hypothetical protein